VANAERAGPHQAVSGEQIAAFQRGRQCYRDADQPTQRDADSGNAGDAPEVSEQLCQHEWGRFRQCVLSAPS